MNIYDLLNINQVDKEKAIVDAITETRKELVGLSEDLTCKIYSSYLSEQLRKRHILYRKLDTKELKCPYSHIFLIVPIDEKECYLIDLTYSQFHNRDFEELLRKGYMRVNTDSLNDYIEITGKKNSNISVKDVLKQERNVSK